MTARQVRDGRETAADVPRGTCIHLLHVHTCTADPYKH
jgi:hypothetical protein